jgi:DNA-binding NtrC family response regulator
MHNLAMQYPDRTRRVSDHMRRILIVDDEPKLARILAGALEGVAGCEVAGDAKSALDLLSLRRFDLVVTDLRMPGIDGMTLLREVRRRASATPVILMTAFARAEDAVEAMKLGAQDYLVKPFDLDEFRHKVSALLPPGSARAGSPAELEGIVGRSAAMREVFELVERVASRDATVLILGESGTGKELVARALHHRSRRAEGPLVEMHCAALPETLLESELFGHEKGAFTGAAARKIGRLETARGGTLFLDEVGEIPPATQVKLLRFLQERTFVRVGGTETLMVDARFVCATNRDLSRAVADGAFRADLFYRLNVFPIRVPPLREREGDAALLVEHFLRRAGRDRDAFTPEAVALVEAYRWPGNVRELENAVERALILAGEGRVEARHLPAELRPGSLPLQGASAPESLDEMELRAIEEALAKSGGNKRRAAELLGITRRRLYSRIEILRRKARR